MEITNHFHIENGGASGGGPAALQLKISSIQFSENINAECNLTMKKLHR